MKETDLGKVNKFLKKWGPWMKENDVFKKTELELPSQFKEKKRFDELDDDIKLKAVEYYTILKLHSMGNSTPDQAFRLTELLPIICDYNLNANMVGIEL